MVNIDGLRKTIKELSENNNLPEDGKKALVSLANNLIRSEELVLRFSEYFDNGYHFGYFFSGHFTFLLKSSYYDTHNFFKIWLMN